jgi:hypothetical protein
MKRTDITVGKEYAAILGYSMSREANPANYSRSDVVKVLVTSTTATEGGSWKAGQKEARPIEVKPIAFYNYQGEEDTERRDPFRPDADAYATRCVATRRIICTWEEYEQIVAAAAESRVRWAKEKEERDAATRKLGADLFAVQQRLGLIEFNAWTEKEEPSLIDTTVYDDGSAGFRLKMAPKDVLALLERFAAAEGK